MLFTEFGSRRRLEGVETSKQLGETTIMQKYNVFGSTVTAVDKESAVRKYIANLPDYIRDCKIGNTSDGRISIIVNDDEIVFDNVEAFDKLRNPNYTTEKVVHGRPSTIRKLMDYLDFLKWMAE